ncbi:hypothetical protein P5651_21860 [Bacillus subtilis]
MNSAHNKNETNFQRSMKSRHLFMLSLGGVIGTGLFLSSGYTIQQAGPAGTILAYLVGPASSIWSCYASVSCQSPCL